MHRRTAAARLLAASVSPIGAFLLRFVRTLILSHLLVPSEVGAAVLLMSMLSACELVTDVGLDRFVMITGGERRAQAVAVARQIAIARAAILAVLIAWFAPELATVFGAPSLSGSVAWLGLIPLINSCKNWRLDQIQQEFHYGPEAIASISGQVMAIAAVVPGLMLWNDSRLILLSLICETATYVALSHLLVRHQTVARIDASVRRAALAYCLPLMANGLCLMLIKQLDQIIVTHLFGLAALAVYALGFNLAVTPTSPLQTITQKIGLPTLGSAQASPGTYQRTSVLIIVGMVLLAGAYSLSVGVVLDYAVPLLYGGQYHLPSGFATFAMLSAFLRVCRGGPTMILLQRGATGALAVGNVVAGVGALAGLVAGVLFGRLDGVMAGFAFGDLASFAVYLILVRRYAPLRLTLKHCTVLTATIAAAAAILWAIPGTGAMPRLLIFLAGMGMMAIDASLVWYAHRREVAADLGWRPTFNLTQVP